MNARTVVGASDHYARAVLVTLGIEGGAPALRDRRTVALIAENLPTAPCHHEALELPLPEAAALFDRVRRSVREHAERAVATVAAEFGADALILRASPFDRLPDDLAEVLGSRPLTNAADGMLYREALADAAAGAGLAVRRFPRRADPALLAAAALGIEPSAVHALVARFGREAGPPWRRDERRAAAAALSLLGP